MAKARHHHYPEDIFIKITKKIEHFIVKHLKVIIINISVVIIVLAAYFSVDYIFKKNEGKAQNAFDKVYLVYTDLLNKEDMPEEELNKKLIDLNEDFKIVLNNFPKSKAAVKSAYYIGNTLYKARKYEEAVKYFEQGYTINNKFYISFLCLQKEASSYEQLGEYEKAVQVYKKIENEFSDSFILPTVLFNLAQIYEKQDKLEKANDVYSKIVSSFQWSSWKGFAEKRQLLIKNFM